MGIILSIHDLRFTIHEIYSRFTIHYLRGKDMPMRIGDAMPPLDGATTWFNGSLEVTQEHIKGRPTLVHFWAVSCGICKDKMPQLQEMIRKYEPLGLKTIAVHMPRYEADTDLDTINEAMTANKITE